PNQGNPNQGDRTAPPNPVVRYFVGQFRRPRGPLGRGVGWILANRGSNVERGRYLVDLLDLEPDHRVLELGPGPGLALHDAAARVTDGHLVGVDHSAMMLAQCAERNRQPMAEGRLRLVEADVCALPADLVGFDRIYAMNVWHFWSDQERTLVDLAGRLAPGGRLVIGHQPHERGADAADADAARRCLRDQLADAGLDVEDRVLELDPPAVFVIGHRL
ncbi:MAG: class I SAM-dependent methyltransferase, partial [Actinomycetota bacterium]